MRWIFICLLLANAILFAWQLFAEAPQVAAPSGAKAPSQNAPTIILLKEAPRSQVATLSQAPLAESSKVEPKEEASSVAAPERALCTFLGPYDTQAGAQQLVERLAAMEVSASVEELEISAGPGYWVYLEPLASRRDALRYLSELQAQGVDSYIIPRGELENGISLGMFSKKELADARLQELADKGVEASLEVVERSAKEIWVSLPASASRSIGDQAWERLFAGAPEVDKKQNFCLHVASQDNFH